MSIFLLFTYLFLYLFHTREFSAATRNYAKRQLQWYRNDEAFLWLEMNRATTTSSSESMSITDTNTTNTATTTVYSKSPYEKVCQELLYWIDPVTISSPEFQNHIRHQLVCSELMSAIRNRYKGSSRSKKTETKRNKLNNKMKKDIYKQMINTATNVTNITINTNINALEEFHSHNGNKTLEFSNSSTLPMSPLPLVADSESDTEIDNNVDNYNKTRLHPEYLSCLSILYQHGDVSENYYLNEIEKVTCLKNKDLNNSENKLNSTDMTDNKDTHATKLSALDPSIRSNEKGSKNAKKLKSYLQIVPRFQLLSRFTSHHNILPIHSPKTIHNNSNNHVSLSSLSDTHVNQLNLLSRALICRRILRNENNLSEEVKQFIKSWKQHMTT